jgi:redox-sensitive bicupin YhaK (pirin superfamily)
MTAGKGVQHSEMFPLLKKDEENPMELFQIWLNLPKKSKMVDPHFKMIWAEEVPKYSEKAGEASVHVEVLVGKLGNRRSSSAPPDSWAADANNDVAIYNVQLEKGTQWTLPAAAEGVNRTIYYYEGNGLKIDETEVPNYHAADVEASNEITFINPSEDSKILILQGRPINEPVVQHGPFVMNTRQEIQDAFNDYHRTQFGGWPWPKYDQVHDRELGRFAKHSDGKKEIRG